MKQFNIEEYLASGVENVVKGIMKTSLFCPEEAAFIAKFALAAKKSTKIRNKYNEEGIHIPPFLIASITSRCNLHCAGCYARSINSCGDGEPVEQLTAEEWGNSFREAADLGMSFILLAGGEPLVRRDVLEEAAKVKNVIFPVITNGTMLGDEYIRFFDKNRNLIPMVSVEGDACQTDERRGKGIYRIVSAAMEKMKEKKITFGVSITVTKENYRDVLSESFVADLKKQGCKAVIYVEFVPTSEDAEHLAPENAEREWFAEHLNALRSQEDEMFFIAFPGDEDKSEGCLAAGRGFFHINSHGGAEPCPFSPYSDANIKDTGILGALKSKLFQALKSGDLLHEDHKGGCVLFSKAAEVEKLL